MTAECPDCGGRGWIVAAEDRSARVCACRQHRPAEDLLRAAGVPPQYLHCSRETWEGAVPSPDRWAELSRWAAEPETDPWCILILGKERGVGKTHLATAILRAALERDPKCGATWYALRDAVRMTQAEFAVQPRPTHAALFGRAPLLLDEVGGERPTEYALALVADVLDHAHRWMRPVILTANADSPDELGKVYGARIGSRLWEGTLIERLSGKDRRRQPATPPGRWPQEK